MIKKILLATSLLISLTLAGCATPTKMAFHDNSYKQTEKPIFLMTATINNTYKTSHQPKLLVVNIEKDIVNGSKDRINFAMDDKAKNESDDPNIGSTYLLRMELESGDYIIRGLTSMSSSFPIHGYFFAPIHEKIKANESGIYYLGHINATVRERVGDEFKAGSSIPLIDQAIAGASGGTFNIEITDQWEKDEALFKSKFPALGNTEVKKAVLPKFDRERAQKWWAEH